MSATGRPEGEFPGEQRPDSPSSAKERADGRTSAIEPGAQRQGMTGRAWVFGDNVDTDVLAPGQYMKGGIEELARHCLEAVDPAFAGSVRAGDFVVGARNFGAGSSREQAPQALKHLGVAALLAQSYAGLFYRNAVNLGLPAIVCTEARRIRPGDRLRVHAAAGLVENLSSGETLACEPIPGHLMQLLEDGGLLPHLEKRLARARRGAP